MINTLKGIHLINRSFLKANNSISVVNQPIQIKLIKFLQEELAIPPKSIVMAMRHEEHDSDQSQLPMILWKYGLITLQQLDKIFDWLETA